MGKFLAVFLTFAFLPIVSQAYSLNADPSAEPRPFGFGEPAGQSADSPALTDGNCPGDSEVVCAKG